MTNASLTRYDPSFARGHDAYIEQQVPSSGVMDFVKTYRRHLWLFLLVAGTVMALTAAYVFLQVPRYTATTTLVIAPHRSQIGADEPPTLDDPATDSSVDTQVELLKSRTLAAMVVDRLHLADTPRFTRLMWSPGPFARLPGLDAQHPPRAMSAAGRRDTAIDRLQQELDVSRTAQTFALQLSFTHPDRQLATQIANAFAGLFVAQTVAVKREGVSAGDALLRRQLASARGEVEAADAALGNYRVAHNLMSVQGSTNAEQQLASLDEQVALARASQAEASARLQTARQQLAAGSNGDDLGEALNSPVIQQLRSQHAQLSAKMAELSNRYGEKYPALANTRQELSATDDQIHGEITRIISNLKAQQEVASGRVASLAGSAGAARGDVAQNNIAAVQLGGLQLRSDTARSSYGALLNRVNELGTEAATMQPDARVAAAAATPSAPSSPNVPIDLIVGALLAIAAGIGAVFIRQGTDQGIRTLEDVENRLRLPYLAGLPTLSSAVRHPTVSDPVAALLDHRESAFAEGYRSLATSVLEAAGSGLIRTIALTSALPNEGKTTTAIGLARILAMNGTSVVLVDADMRHPSVAAALAMRPVAGLQQVLEGDATLDEALILDEESGLSVLPMLRTGRPSSAMLSNGVFDRLLDTLKERFQLVIIDASPVLPVVDGRLVAKKADAAVLLVRWRKTPDAAVEMAAHMLRSLGVRMTGVALTRVDLNELARSGYGDPAQFMGSYSEYYGN